MKELLLMPIIKVGIVLGVIAGAICTTLAAEWEERQRARRRT